MPVYKIALLFIFCIFLFGCQQTNDSTHSENTNIKHLSANPNHETAAQAKALLLDKKDMKAVHAVNTNDTMLVTIEVPHLERFSLQNKRKTYQKELERAFPHMHVELSTDQKIVLEVFKLEEQIKNQTLTEKEIKKKIKELIQLSKEQT